MYSVFLKGGICVLNYLPAALTTGVILENGGTDAPNSVSSCVASGALSSGKAIVLAAVCNFMGAIVSGLFFPRVALKVSELSGLSQSDDPTLALTAAMLSVLIWTGLAWLFSIPTSESHALLAALGGAAGATEAGIGIDSWGAMIAVAAASIAAGWLGGAAAEKLLTKIKINEKHYPKVQIALAGISAVLHGSQDGQKFMCVLAFCLFSAPTEKLPFAVVIWCSAFMALGTALCGKRMLGLAENLGISDRRSGLASDLGGSAVLLLSTLLGLPVSTTHVKTASAAGAGKKGKEKKETVLRLCFAWALTFPACAFLAKGLIFLSELFFCLA